MLQLIKYNQTGLYEFDEDSLIAAFPSNSQWTLKKIELALKNGEKIGEKITKALLMYYSRTQNVQDQLKILRVFALASQSDEIVFPKLELTFWTRVIEKSHQYLLWLKLFVKNIDKNNDLILMLFPLLIKQSSIAGRNYFSLILSLATSLISNNRIHLTDLSLIQMLVSENLSDKETLLDITALYKSLQMTEAMIDNFTFLKFSQ